MFLSHKSWLLPAKLLCISIRERLIVAAEDEFAHSLFLLRLLSFLFFLITRDAHQGDNIFFAPSTVIICFGLKAANGTKKAGEVVLYGCTNTQAWRCTVSPCGRLSGSPHQPLKVFNKLT